MGVMMPQKPSFLASAPVAAAPALAVLWCDGRESMTARTARTRERTRRRVVEEMVRW